MATTMTLRRRLTPPEVAELYGIALDKVHAWIKSGELRAVNVATRVGQRPRYVIDPDDLAEFERRREIVPGRRSKRRQQDTDDYERVFPE